jgi:hypothetical protein
VIISALKPYPDAKEEVIDAVCEYNDLVHALKPSLWAREALGFTPDPWQAQVLDSIGKKILLCCSRQSGKSSVSAILALHTAIFQPGNLVLMVSPSLRQSSELFRKFLSYLEILEAMPSRAEDTKLSLKLDNSSRVISLPGSEGTIRGYSSVNLLIVDEAARVVGDLYFAVKPMLAVSRGRLLALSTPFGKRGWYFNEWSAGLNWEKYSVKATDCPRISPEFLAEEQRSMPSAWFAAEYMCEFTESVDNVFGYDDVMAAVSSDVEPLEV